MSEELCEIVCSCNANDIQLLRMIKHFRSEGKREFQQKMIAKSQNDISENRTDENENTNKDWAFLIRSLLKFQSKGVVQLEFLSSLGTISSNNIDRFHITLFGQNLLRYIEGCE